MAAIDTPKNQVLIDYPADFITRWELGTGKMAQNKGVEEIAVVFTGGTIGMEPREGGEGVVPAGDFDRLMDELGLDHRGVRLRPVAWGDRPSPHMTPRLMFQLAKDVDDILGEPSVRGAVVLHGTDVMVESAFMADLTVLSPKPVVFTGSMRFISELGYDGIRNLYGGIHACLLPVPPELGVLVLMTDRLFSAREAVKINSLNIDAFESPEAGPVGYIVDDQVLLTRRSVDRHAAVKAWDIEENIPLVTCFTGMDGSLIEHLVGQEVKGLVIEAFGAGNVPPAIVPALEKAVGQGIPVVVATRSLEGGVWPIYAYPGGAVDLRERGAILAGRLSGPKARLLLMVALALTDDVREIKRIFSY